MIESHCNPSVALSDAKQQLTPDELSDLLYKQIKVKDKDSDSPEWKENIDQLRAKIDIIDENILYALGSRMKISRQIGEYKKNSNIAILQTSRWDKVLAKVIEKGNEYDLPEDFIKAVSPSSAVISVGDNSYGHPHREALQWAKDNGILLYRTDELGDIVCSISVDGIVFNSSPSEIEIIPEETYDFKCEEGTYSWILNTRSKKIHYPSCSGVKTMSEKNKSQSDDSVENLIAEGYSTCGTCFK